MPPVLTGGYLLVQPENVLSYMTVRAQEMGPTTGDIEPLSKRVSLVLIFHSVFHQKPMVVKWFVIIEQSIVNGQMNVLPFMNANV